MLNKLLLRPSTWRIIRPTQTCNLTFRNFLTKHKQSVWKSYLNFIPRDLFKERFKVFEGYEIIYQAKFSGYLRASLIIFYFCIVLCIYSIRLYVVDKKEWKTEVLGKSFHPIITVGLALHAVILYFLLTRSIRVIYRKGNKFKSMSKGIFGTYNAKYVDHSLHECIAKRKYTLEYYKLHGRIVLLNKYEFKNEQDYYDMCIIPDELD